MVAAGSARTFGAAGSSSAARFVGFRGCLIAQALAAVVTVLGVRYAAFGITVLFNLSSVTAAWILASGDPDFRLDFAMFRLLGGVAAALVSALGMLSAVYGAGRIIGRDWARRRWMLLTLLALVVHVLRIPIELIAGSLTVWSVCWFALVCSIYAALWLIDGDRVRWVRRVR
jgi:hypothetical protein